MATPVGFLPTNIDPSQLFTALINGAQQGSTAAISDLLNPTNYNYLESLEDFPWLSTLVNALNTFGFTDATRPSQLLTNLPALLELVRNILSEFANFPISDATLLSSPTDIINDLSGTLSADYATLLPIADTGNALLTSLPADAANILVDQIQAGDPLGGIEDAIGVGAGLIPFALFYGTIAPVAETLAGTLVNLVDLIPGI